MKISYYEQFCMPLNVTFKGHEATAFIALPCIKPLLRADIKILHPVAGDWSTKYQKSSNQPRRNESC